MSERLSGKKALVTGASKGVGKGIALELAAAGCDVAINYHRDEAGAYATAEAVMAAGRNTITIAADTGNAREAAAMFDAALDAFGKLDIVVANAGVQTWKPLLELTEEEWDRVINTNLKGAFLCTQHAGLHMKEHGGGNIILIGSGSNKIAFPLLSSYTASKGGIEMFTKVAAAELGQYQIRVNCIAPGAIEVERTKHESSNYALKWGRETPLGRVGTPADIGRACVMISSPEAAFITGQTIWVDGGVFSKAIWPEEPKAS
ncbi:MAG: SDR family oxidoreductase [Bryobacterales bacterium]|nr:SDR family oxidoreductase [Bryobacterales bacterium]